MTDRRRRIPRVRVLRISALVVLVLIGALGVRWWLRQEKRSHFVSVGEKGFELEGAHFFPLALNYMLTKRLVGDSLWIGPSMDYPDSADISTGPATDMHDLRAHMELIRELGFNTVRLVGCSDVVEREGRAYLPFRDMYKEDKYYAVDSVDIRRRYLDALVQVLAIVREAGLKVVLHVGIMPTQPSTEDHFITVADRLSDDNTILAYDLFNEPLYFDPVWRDKSEVNVIGERWRALMREHAPWQLWTIGLANLREFLEWDPSIINADFISFHPYEHEPQQVLNELYYYKEHCPKPWIVGETSIPADNDSVPYADQLEFAKSTLRQAVACGAWGYSWWQFKDVDWHRFHPNFMGVLNREGKTRTRSGALVAGSVKPVGEAFHAFDPSEPVGESTCPSNYFNWTPGSGYRLAGRITNKEGQGIGNGIVMAWNQDWSALCNTVTHPDGRFELVTDIPLAHWTASAPNHTRIQGELDNMKPDPLHGGLKQELGDLVLWIAPLRE